ncbi:hypothetical protein O4N82_22055 [Vibrio parahaemolyticus]|uniref:hypothetical protein n=1 Tax=Vibrio parahaemolyticus TaxID=670 RepID=UPI0022B578FA|nr:hypothetical protein [Vibrio parahaemolyticus]EGU0149934.1 hypothetical protein [Vibrio parahaemolyticus]MCZ6381965.1 hypothetical protein [Vibrio parahaemolyticus]MCZ6404401.1 hypothetical protein [Vibrio parahaemolyticus]
MPSSEEYIRNALSKFIEDLNSPISFSKSVQFNLENIQKVNKSGFTISYIMKSISMKQTEATFRNAIARAKKKKERKSEENTPSKERVKISTSSTTSNVDSKENTINIDKYSEDEWVKAWGFSLSKGLTPLMIAELMKYGWTPHNYHKLKDKHNLFNSKRLINISSDMKRHKATNKDYQ